MKNAIKVLSAEKRKRRKKKKYSSVCSVQTTVSGFRCLLTRFSFFCVAFCDECGTIF